MQDFLGWYIVTAPHTVKLYLCRKWCKENLPSDTWQYEDWIERFSFKHEMDAAVFKLTFGI